MQESLMSIGSDRVGDQNWESAWNSQTVSICLTAALRLWVVQEKNSAMCVPRNPVGLHVVIFRSRPSAQYIYIPLQQAPAKTASPLTTFPQFQQSFTL